MSEQEHDQKKSRWARILQVLIPIVSVGIALTSLLVGIASRKKELACSLVSSSNIVTVDPTGIDPDLKVQFRGAPVRTLSKLTFSIRNTGSAAIKADDVKEPIRVSFPSQNRVLLAGVEGTAPQHFSFGVRLDSSANTVFCDFPLLNPGDEAFFSVYIQAAGGVRPSFDGRVVDVSQMLYSDKSDLERSPGPRLLNTHAVRVVVRWTLTILYCVLALFFIVVWIVEIVRHIGRSLWMRQHKDLLKKKIDELRRKEIESRETMKAVSERLGKPYESRGPSEWYLDYQAAELLNNEGIRKRPGVIWESAVGVLGGSILLIALTAVSTITTWIIFFALRG